ncbi:MAG: AmmeMemoRadiSam system protein A [Coriobacteriales bacterium]|jgi:AmmeMemoRadiSam system protein A|nr:AmmeMemoRadiSam system protein A [Coriobacteriales bacterium]
MSIVAAFVVPHPPLLIPGIGDAEKPRVHQTQDAYQRVCRHIARLQPQTIVVFSPHAQILPDHFEVSGGRGATGDFSRFGARETNQTYTVSYDQTLAAAVLSRLKAAHLAATSAAESSSKLDHGFLVPWHFIQQEAFCEVRALRVGLSGLDLTSHYRFGHCLAAAAADLDRRVVLVASGDLSHRLLASGPYGFTPQGPRFDKQLITILASGDLANLLYLDPQLCEQAGECGLRSFVMMAGALQGLDVVPRLLSYEGPFGVGYAVASFVVESLPVALARTGLEAFFRSGEIPNKKTPEIAGLLRRANNGEGRGVEYGDDGARDDEGGAGGACDDGAGDDGARADESDARSGFCQLDTPSGSRQLLQQLSSRRAGAFVSLHRQGELRGCIGTIAPSTASVIDEIIQNALSAARNDPRFAPLSAAELDDLDIKVDILGLPEPVASASELDAQRFGVIVSCGLRRGLLLPALEGVESPDQQLAIALCKAGIARGESYHIERFEVERYT